MDTNYFILLAFALCQAFWSTHLAKFALQGLNVRSYRSSPSAGNVSKPSSFTLRPLLTSIDRDVYYDLLLAKFNDLSCIEVLTHYGLVPQTGCASHIEQDSHIIGVISRVE